MRREICLLVAIATLAAAAVFSPLRRRVQAVVDRQFNRTRYDAVRTVDAFARGLRGTTDISLLGPAVVRVVHDTVQPASSHRVAGSCHPGAASVAVWRDEIT